LPPSTECILRRHCRRELGSIDRYVVRYTTYRCDYPSYPPPIAAENRHGVSKTTFLHQLKFCSCNRISLAPQIPNLAQLDLMKADCVMGVKLGSCQVQGKRMRSIGSIGTCIPFACAVKTTIEIVLHLYGLIVFQFSSCENVVLVPLRLSLVSTTQWHPLSRTFSSGGTGLGRTEGTVGPRSSIRRRLLHLSPMIVNELHDH